MNHKTGFPDLYIYCIPKYLVDTLRKLFCLCQMDLPGFTDLTRQMSVTDKLCQCDLLGLGCSLIVIIFSTSSSLSWIGITPPNLVICDGDT